MTEVEMVQVTRKGQALLLYLMWWRIVFQVKRALRQAVDVRIGPSPN